MIDESILIQSCIAGNRKAQSTLYYKYEERMYAICLRYAKDKNEALDILQEGYIRIFKGLSSFRGQSQLKFWLDRIMSNTAIRYIYHGKKITFEENETLDKLINNYDEQQHSFNKDDIISLINKLPLGYKTVFNMYAIEGYSHNEISKTLGITEGGSRSQYSRAKKAIQHLLSINRIR